MITRSRTISIFFALAVLAGCASTNVTQQTPMVSPGLARPNQIWVYDFIADPARLPADSAIGPGLSAPSTPPTAEELETGRRLSAIITKSLVANIQAMGLPAVQAGPGAAPQVGDGVIRGYLVSVVSACGDSQTYKRRSSQSRQRNRLQASFSIPSRPAIAWSASALAMV